LYCLDDQGRQPRKYHTRKIVDLQHGPAWQGSLSATTDYGPEPKIARPRFPATPSEPTRLPASVRPGATGSRLP
ncbi:hypothetical protein, partial [Nonomuraea sp. KM90]|uniref:hypothetical protein n=1 Tax=Nonomuraea sp. KM90 TaxID=3457428 RepID=UPI003FCE1FC2